ncbi:PREDICTED: eukaryotic translation initiation factor 4B2-like [Ipomoea nil]|uniref:eukaryotic translation initiation factor 4B2-like n=1 Tax=Ipomoea nil TaxID=35883 RepID=UPI000900E25C|nr:PREDICTED: eukaryotic translation initiation factor 4B2-like [Ipomoea nil]
MSKSPWGNIGDWAAEAEREEAEERERAAQHAAAAANKPAAAAAAAGDSQNYPSLKEAASTKQKKKTKMSLQQFTMQSSYGSGHGYGSTSRLTTEEMLRLPTGPKERSAEEMQQGRLGGGFSNYGARSMGPPPGRIRDRDIDGEASWGGDRRQYGGFENEQRKGPQSRAPDFDQPSRADEVDNWASAKKPLPSYNSAPTQAPARSKYGALGGGGGASRADGDDNWGASKKPVSSPPARSSTFGSGMRDSRPEPDRWSRDGVQRLVLESPKNEQGGDNVKVNKPNPFGAARPREEVLAEKGLDWKKMDMESEVSRPTSAQSSRPGSSQSGRSEGLQGMVEEVVTPVRAKPKVNPFGDAKPREVLLEEKGIDWRKIDLVSEHQCNERPESEEEKKLKEEIESLKKEALQSSGEDQARLHHLINEKEKDLNVLVQDLDKIHLSEKGMERPGSGSGRVSGFSERSPSQRGGQGSFDERRTDDFVERPKLYGTQDALSRPFDDRRAFQAGRTGEDRRAYQGGRHDDRRSFRGGRERGGFFSDRDMERSRSGNRW